MKCRPTAVLIDCSELDLGRSLGQRPQRGSRDDDNLEACKRRLWLYRQNTMPLLKQLDEDSFIVKASSGPRYVVGCRKKVPRGKLKVGARVTLDMTTLTIMRVLPREVDPTVFNMLSEDPGKISWSSIGGLNEQIRELRETIELPLTSPDLFIRVGIKPPKGVLLYGPPGTGKTLLARALACNLNATFLKIVASAIVDKYIGESARLVREMFGLPAADRRATPRAPRSRRGPPMSPRSPALELPPRQSPRKKPEAKATPRKKAKAEAPPPQPAAKKKTAPFRAFEERWERRATHKRSAAAEKQLLAKYGGREFRDDDGAYVISTDNLEWTDGEWCVLAQKKRKKKEEYEGYCVNAQLRKMIARSLPAREVQRK